MSARSVSVIARGPLGDLRARLQRPLGCGFELIEVGLDQTYAEAMDRATGEILVFMTGDVWLVGESIAERVADALRRHAVVGLAGARWLAEDRSIFELGPGQAFGHFVNRTRDGQYGVSFLGMPRSEVGGLGVVDPTFFAVGRATARRCGFEGHIEPTASDLLFAERVARTQGGAAVIGGLAAVRTRRDPPFERTAAALAGKVGSVGRRSFAVLAVGISQMVVAGEADLIEVVDPQHIRRPVPLPPAGPPFDGVISVVICSVDSSRFERAAGAWGRALRDTPHEVIRISDARGICEGYNRGGRQARGHAIVFAHDDLTVCGSEFGGRLRSHLGRFDLVGVAGSTRFVGSTWPWSGPPYQVGMVAMPNEETRTAFLPYAVPSVAVGGIRTMDGCFLACRREVFERLGFDESTFPDWHGYDADFSVGAWRSGFLTAVATDLPLLHDSEGRQSQAWWRACAAMSMKHVKAIEARPRAVTNDVNNVLVAQSPADEAGVARCWDRIAADCRGEGLT